MTKEEIQEQHPKEVTILLEIYKRSITHIEGYEKLTWATSFQISEVIEAMGVHTAHLTDQIKSMENYISDVDGQVKELREEKEEQKQIIEEIKKECELFGQTITNADKAILNLDDKLEYCERQRIEAFKELESLQKELEEKNGSVEFNNWLKENKFEHTPMYSRLVNVTEEGREEYEHLNEYQIKELYKPS